MTETSTNRPETRPALSRNKGFAWAMLAILVSVGGWLVWRIQTTIGLSAPRLWELLRNEPVFDLAMLDFVLTASWVVLVMIDRSSWRSPRLWISLAVAFAIPSLGIVLFVLLDRKPATAPSEPITNS